jgi:hypothetical protein
MQHSAGAALTMGRRGVAGAGNNLFSTRFIHASILSTARTQRSLSERNGQSIELCW